MECDFSYGHYREILSIALKRGYVFRGFQPSGSLQIETPTIYLRHDIDADIIGAIELAQIEHRLSISATYCVMVDSAMYNLFGDLERYCLDKIKDFGHQIGLHIDAATYPDRHIETILATLRGILPLEQIVSFHKPTSDVLGKTRPYYISTYEPRFFSDIQYVSDSQGRWWRGGCPCQWLNAEKYPRIQILTHPIHWGGVASVDNAKQIVANKVSDIKQYLKTLHLKI